MADRIRVLIVDDIPETRDHLARLLGFEDDVEVVGDAASGLAAIELARTLLPDVVLMDINMPELDGIAATERLTALLPSAAVVMMSVQGEPDTLRRAMLAGAREFLVKPFSSDELTTAIRHVHRREREKADRLGPVAAPAQTSGTSGSAPHAAAPVGRVVAFVSPKGGVGRTTIAVNTAVAAAQESGKRVVLVDGSFQFGDVGVLLNLNPKNRSVADLIKELETPGEHDSLDSYVVRHSSGIGVLLAPPSPELAELVTPAGLRKVLDALRHQYDLVIVDGGASLNEESLTVLDTADAILAVLTLEITSIKNMRLFLDVAEQLGYGDRVEVVLNRADSSLGVRTSDAEQSIGRRVSHTIVSDGRNVVSALNRGVPFFLSSREAQVSQDVRRLALALAGVSESPESVPSPAVRRMAPRRSLLAWR